MAMRVGACARRRNPGHPFGPGPARRYQPFLRRLATKAKTVLALVLVAAVLAGPCLAEPQGPLDQEPAAPAAATDFDACVRLALRQSPHLTKSALEIEVKHLDEADSRYRLLPPVSFRTFYYVNRPSDQDLNPRAYSLQFLSESYNPFEAYFSLQARKLMTQIAVLAHLQVIADGLQRLGRMFLELETLKRLAAWQTEVVNLARQNLTYAESRLKSGDATTLEVRVAAQEVELAQAEQERLAAAQTRTLESLKSFLGLKPAQGLTPDLKEARRQVLGPFDPAAATLDQARARSYEIKILEIKKQLQAYNVTLAKTKLLPNFIMGVQTPDPLSLTRAGGIYFYVGLDVPVWDGFQRVRNISRQKTILRQMEAETELKDSDLSGKWQVSQEDLRGTALALKVAQSQEELAVLKERQSEIRHKSGGEPLSVFLEGRRGHLEARKNTVLKSMEYDLAILGLRHLSGDLGHSYVDASSWDK